MNLTPERQAEYDAHRLWLITKGKKGNRLDWSAADLNHSDLSGADLREANLRLAGLIGANLSKAILYRADLAFANLMGVDLCEANLLGVKLLGVNLFSANLNRADLSEASFAMANLFMSNFDESVIGYTTFAGVDLSTVAGLDTVTHNGPSSIGIDTLYKSKGIPEVFLRGAGVPDQLIEYYHSLVGKAIEYYSCFISYSSKNQGFAERLHIDLQSNGVRCWFAPEDMKIGDKLRVTIDHAIRVHEKLLLILSEASVNSQWVEQEVEAALERERMENHPVLFPVRIDNAVMDTDAGWAAAIRRTCHIGDFCQWKDHDAYQRSFQRLMRDLKTGEVNAHIGDAKEH